jgi:hypothetical protein
VFQSTVIGSDKARNAPHPLPTLQPCFSTCFSNRTQSSSSFVRALCTWSVWELTQGEQCFVAFGIDRIVYHLFRGAFLMPSAPTSGHNPSFSAWFFQLWGPQYGKGDVVPSLCPGQDKVDPSHPCPELVKCQFGKCLWGRSHCVRVQSPKVCVLRVRCV